MTAPRPEEVLRIMQEHVPFNRYLGIEGESVGHGRAVLRLPVRHDHVGEIHRRPAA